MARKAATRYPDLTIVFRKDRNGFEGWYGGKAEAFRKTAEKVDAFFQKKYGESGKLLETVLTVQEPVPHTVVLRTELEPKAPKAAKVKAPKAPKVAKAKAAPRMEHLVEIDPDSYDSEDRLYHSDLAALL